MEEKVNFFLVGPEKTGTTSLHYYLSQHPEIFMSSVKEPQFFNTEHHEEHDMFRNKTIFHKLLKSNSFNIRTREDYEKLFEGLNGEKIIGESTPRYLISENALKGIYNYNPDAKILIILREPVDYVYSQYSQYYFTNHENLKSFEKAWKFEDLRKKGKKIPITAKVPSLLLYSERAFFSYYIKKYLEYFPSCNVKIILFDDMKKNTEEVYKDILKFLQVNDVDFTPDFIKKNDPKIVRSKLLNNFVNYKKLWYLPDKFFPEFLAKIRDKLNSLNIKKGKRKINEDFKRQLMDYYKTEVEELNKLLHEYGYLEKDRDLMKLRGYEKI